MSQQKAQGAYLSVSTAEAAADVITAITAASPPVITSASHGITAGSIVRVAGVSGMVQVNNRAFVAGVVATNTLELRGIDGTDYSAYVSGGSMFAQTMAEIGYNRQMGGFDGEAGDIDVTHLRSIEKEYLADLADPGNFTMQLWVPSVVDSAQTRVRKLKETGAATAFSLTLASGQVAAFMGCVKSFALQDLSTGTAVAASVSIRLRSALAWFS